MLDSIAKVTVIIATALMANACLRRGSAASRHLVLSAAIVCATIVPAVARLVPAWQVSMPRAMGTVPAPRAIVPAAESVVAGGYVADFAEPPLVARAKDSPSPRDARLGLRSFLAIWIVGVAGSLLVLLSGLWRLSRVASTAAPLHDANWRSATAAIASQMGIRRRIRLLVGQQPSLLVTWGHWRPVVLVPASAVSWPSERVRVVLGHELAHVQRGDWLALIGAELLRAFHWFNPLVWIACRRLRVESERACDDVVLAYGIDAPAYASHLLDIARSFGRPRRAWLPAPAMARASSLERRIGAMLNPQLNRRPVTRATRSATMLAGLLLTAAVAGLGAEEQTFGTLSGTVVDTTNRPVGAVTLVLSGRPDQAKHELRSDAGGRFEFVGVPPGDYRLDAFAAGFAPYRTDVVITASTLQRTVTLQVGSLMETVTVSSVRVAAPSAAEPPLPDSSGCVSTAAGGRIEPPLKLRDVPVGYPPSLHAAKVDGRVVLEGRIGTDGTMRELRVVVPAHPDFEAAAIEGVRQWRFSRTLLNCVPVEVSMTIYVNFVPPQ